MVGFLCDPVVSPKIRIMQWHMADLGLIYNVHGNMYSFGSFVSCLKLLALTMMVMLVNSCFMVIFAMFDIGQASP